MACHNNCHYQKYQFDVFYGLGFSRMYKVMCIHLPKNVKRFLESRVQVMLAYTYRVYEGEVENPMPYEEWCLRVKDLMEGEKENV